MSEDPARHLDSAVAKLYSSGFARFYDPLMWFVDRVAARRAWAAFRERLAPHLGPETRILDAGCGTGRTLRRLECMNAVFARYLGVDRSDAMLNFARRRYAHDARVSFEVHDLNRLSLDDPYDIIISSWVLSHMDRPQELVRRLRAHLAPSGRLFLIYLSHTPEEGGAVPAFISFVFRHLFHSVFLPAEITEKFEGVIFRRKYFWNLVTFAEVAAETAPAREAEREYA